ncbi:hypothetical protein QQ045_006059 [Rhodiola kirilowii]
MSSLSNSDVISNGSSPPAPASTVFTSAIPHNPILLDGSNFLLWKTITLPNMSGLNLYGHLDGTLPPPEMMITEGEGDMARSVPNPAYQIWWQQNQRVLGALLTSMTPEVVTQMVGLRTAAQITPATTNPPGIDVANGTAAAQEEDGPLRRPANGPVTSQHDDSLSVIPHTKENLPGSPPADVTALSDEHAAPPVARGGSRNFSD